MRIDRKVIVPIACVLLCSKAALAEPLSYTLPEERASFRPGPGMEVTQDNCLSCHSADYVSTQPPQLGPRYWESVVQKMIKAYRAPISDADAKAIVDYLSHVY